VTKEKLRDIVRKSPNPRKSLAYFQMKSEEFLNGSFGIKKDAPPDHR
jgi:hypothetical protein